MVRLVLFSVQMRGLWPPVTWPGGPPGVHQCCRSGDHAWALSDGRDSSPAALAGKTPSVMFMRPCVPMQDTGLKKYLFLLEVFHKIYIKNFCYEPFADGISFLQACSSSYTYTVKPLQKSHQLRFSNSINSFNWMLTQCMNSISLQEVKKKRQCKKQIHLKHNAVLVLLFLMTVFCGWLRVSKGVEKVLPFGWSGVYSCILKTNVSIWFDSSITLAVLSVVIYRCVNSLGNVRGIGHCVQMIGKKL